VHYYAYNTSTGYSCRCTQLVQSKGNWTLLLHLLLLTLRSSKSHIKYLEICLAFSLCNSTTSGHFPLCCSNKSSFTPLNEPAPSSLMFRYAIFILISLTCLVGLIWRRRTDVLGWKIAEVFIVVSATCVDPFFLKLSYFCILTALSWSRYDKQVISRSFISHQFYPSVFEILIDVFGLLLTLL